MSGPYLVPVGPAGGTCRRSRSGVFVSLMAVSGTGGEHLAGPRYDRTPAGRRRCGLARLRPGYALLATTTSYGLLLVIGRRFWAPVPAFLQLFRSRGEHSTAGIGPGHPGVAAVFSLAWAIGPRPGAAVLAWQDFAGTVPGHIPVLRLVAISVLLLAPPPRQRRLCRPRRRSHAHPHRPYWASVCSIPRVLRFGRATAVRDGPCGPPRQ